MFSRFVSLGGNLNWLLNRVVTCKGDDTLVGYQSGKMIIEVPWIMHLFSGDMNCVTKDMSINVKGTENWKIPVPNIWCLILLEQQLFFVKPSLRHLDTGYHCACKCQKMFLTFTTYASTWFPILLCLGIYCLLDGKLFTMFWISCNFKPVAEQNQI